MAEARELMWLQLCSEDKIPAFLVSWLEYVRTLGMYDTPSYAWLMRLLEHSQDPASGNTKRRRTSAAEDVIDIKKQKMDVYAPEE